MPATFYSQQLDAGELPEDAPISPLHLPHISATSPIITHQGRTAEGGHYVAWVKKDKATWLVFDDETVAEIPAERIKELYGGGDWHMAYMCFYRKMDGLTLDDKPELKLKQIETKGWNPGGAGAKD